MPTSSKLETTFANAWAIAGNGLTPVHEYRFHASRLWRFDFAWPANRIAVECEGGTFRPGKIQGRGRHLTSKGFHEDCDKYNAAAALGWRVLRFDAKHLRSDPVGCVEQVVAALNVGGCVSFNLDEMG